MSIGNLRAIFDQADAVDRQEGMQAYQGYRDVMAEFATAYDIPLPRVTAAFVALSPNSDYLGNLRSLMSLAEGFRDCVPVEQITVSTYKHCRDRAWSYLIGEREFLQHAKGPKIRSFYRNILDPSCPYTVTVDGHVVASWRGEHQLTMKQALVSRRDYERIRLAVCAIGAQEYLLGHQVQAIIWMTRKRLMRIKYDGQTDLLRAYHPWSARVSLSEIRPYGTEVAA